MDPALLAQEPSIAWRGVAGMRDVLTHRYFDTAHGVVATTVTTDVPQLTAAVRRLLEGLDADDPRHQS